MLLLVEAFLKNGLTNTILFQSSMKYRFQTFLLAKLGEKVNLKTEDCTSISHWSQGVDKAHSWRKSISKVFLCSQGITVASKWELLSDQNKK